MNNREEQIRARPLYALLVKGEQLDRHEARINGVVVGRLDHLQTQPAGNRNAPWVDAYVWAGGGNPDEAKALRECHGIPSPSFPDPEHPDAPRLFDTPEQALAAMGEWFRTHLPPDTVITEEARG